MQGQAKALHPLAEHRQYPLCVVPAFETEDTVIRVANKYGSAIQPRPDLLVEPKIQRMMQVEVTQQRRQS